MKFITLEYWDNLERGELNVRPNKIVAYKSAGVNTKLYVENFPNAIMVSKPIQEVKEILENANLRPKVSRRTPKEGDTEINQRPVAESGVSNVQEDYDSRLFVESE